MELAGHQILGLVLLYFLIGFIISIPVVKEIQNERGKSLLKSRKLPNDKFVRNIVLILWPIVVLISIFKKTKKVK